MPETSEPAPEPAPGRVAASGSHAAPRSRRDLRQGIVGDLVLGLVALAALGAVAGLAWYALATPAVYVREGQDVSMGQLELGRRFGVDGWFVGIGLVAGIVAGLVLTWWRTSDPVRMLVIGALGAGLAALACQYVGRQLGTDPADMDRLAKALKEGQSLPVPFTLTWTAELLAWPVGYLAGAVSVLLGSRRVDDREPAYDDGTAPAHDEPSRADDPVG